MPPVMFCLILKFVSSSGSGDIITPSFLSHAIITQNMQDRSLRKVIFCFFNKKKI